MTSTILEVLLEVLVATLQLRQLLSGTVLRSAFDYDCRRPSQSGLTQALSRAVTECAVCLGASLSHPSLIQRGEAIWLPGSGSVKLYELLGVAAYMLSAAVGPRKRFVTSAYVRPQVSVSVRAALCGAHSVGSPAWSDA